jgi:hypothetical protein
MLFISLILAFLFLFLSTGDHATLSAEVEPTAADATDGYLNVVGTVPLAHEMMEKRFILFFDRAIDMNVADFAKHVSIEPAVSGGPSVGDNYIAFSSGYFRAGTIYRVALSPSLRSVDGKPLNPEHRTFFFATEAMKLAKMWVREQDRFYSTTR